MSSTTSLFFFSPSQCLLRAYGADKYNEWTGGEHSKGFWQKERGSLCATYQRVYWLPSAVFLFRCQRLSLRRLLLSTSLFSVVLSIKKKKKAHACSFMCLFILYVWAAFYCIGTFPFFACCRFFFCGATKKKKEPRHDTLSEQFIRRSGCHKWLCFPFSLMRKTSCLYSAIAMEPFSLKEIGCRAVTLWSKSSDGYSPRSQLPQTQSNNSNSNCFFSLLRTVFNLYQKKKKTHNGGLSWPTNVL